MSNLRKSPQRGSFQLENLLKRVESGETTMDHVDEMKELYQSWDQQTLEKEQTEEWRINNMEYDLRTSEYIAEKCKKDSYAQNLYAALCNNDFVKNDVWPLLKGDKWSCSWRYAGGIIANIREEGDYIDWYCSGIRGGYDTGGGPEEDNTGYVGEGVVTDEIQQDLFKIGWIVVTDNTEE